MLLLLVGTSAGCGPDAYQDPDAYEAAVIDPQGPFVQSVTQNGLTLRTRYAPPALMSLGARRHLEEIRRQVDTDSSNPNATSGSTSKRNTDRSIADDYYETAVAESSEGTGELVAADD